MENIARSVAPGDHITLMFQGGEPMLAGLDFFRMLTEIADSWPSGISVSYALQTNAMHLDEAWCLFLKKHEFLVGVSHDLLAAQHNAARWTPPAHRPCSAWNDRSPCCKSTTSRLMCSVR